MKQRKGLDMGPISHCFDSSIHFSLHYLFCSDTVAGCSEDMTWATVQQRPQQAWPLKPHSAISAPLMWDIKRLTHWHDTQGPSSSPPEPIAMADKDSVGHGDAISGNRYSENPGATIDGRQWSEHCNAVVRADRIVPALATSALGDAVDREMQSCASSERRHVLSHTFQV